MAFNGLCFITYDGKKNVGRPSNSFKHALEKSQKSFLGQIRVFKSSENSNSYGLEVHRNGQPLLKTMNIHHIKFNNFGNNVMEFTFFGNKIPQIIEFVDKSVLTGFQMNPTHFVKITIHMHFTNYVKYGNLTNEEQKQYHDMIHELENMVAKNREVRNVAISKIACKKELLEKISSSTNQQNTENLADIFSGRRRNSAIPQQAANKKLLCTNYECQCNTCLLKKQAAKDSLTKEYEKKLSDELQKKDEETEEKLASEKRKHDEEANKLNEEIAILHNMLDEKEDEILRQEIKLEDQQNQLNEMYNRQNVELERMERENEELRRINVRQAREIEDKDGEIQQLQEQHLQQQLQIQQLQQQLQIFLPPVQQQPQPQPQASRQVFVTRTGHRYHSRPSCPGLSRANGVWEEPLTQVQSRLTPCLRCY